MIQDIILIIIINDNYTYLVGENSLILLIIIILYEMTALCIVLQVVLFYKNMCEQTCTTF